MKKSPRLLTALLVLVLASLACQAVLPTPQPTATPLPPTATLQPTVPAPAITASQPYQITGQFTYTNDIVTTYYVENAVALVDMYGFVTRDRDWIIPVASQTLGNLEIDKEAKVGKYTLQLPAVPLGQFADVDQDSATDTGLQIFAVSYWPNLAGGPYAEGGDQERGWPGYLASIRTDTENEDEVIGGQLVIWAPDDQQQFPTGFGADAKLFTADDPVAPVPAGYSIVDLEATPFAFSRDDRPELTLYEPPDAAIKDYSQDSYTQAFDKLVAFLRLNYAFNGIPGKQPDWEALITDLRPRVEQAEQNKDGQAFYEALRDFTYAFKDGHVGMGWSDFKQQDFETNYVGSLGFNVRVLDDGQVLVNYVIPGGPAEGAGMRAGAVITQFNGQPVMDALKSQPLFFGLQSSEVGRLYSQALMLMRTSPRGKAKVTFTNPDGQPQTVTLTAFVEVENLNKELGFGDANRGLLPVELKVLTEGDQEIGYLRITSSLDDLNLLLRLVERGLKEFQERKVAGLIIDLRSNSGGANLGLAGFLTTQEIPLSQMQYYSEKTGQFENKGRLGKVLPDENQYSFDKMAVLTGLDCASACELEAYAFSKVPGMLVIGQYPTAGIEAEVSRGQVKMPEGIEMQFPTGREVNPDGSLFLEGVGVQPTLKVPVDASSVLSSEDVVLQAAIQAILGQ